MIFVGNFSSQTDSKPGSDSDTDLIIDERELSYGEQSNTNNVPPDAYKQSPTTISAQINQVCTSYKHEND